MLDDRSELSPTDISILLKHLFRDRQALTYDEKTIKLATPISNAPPEPITHQDTTVASLRSLIKSLHSRSNALTESITHFDRAAREALARKSRAAAHSALRSKKVAESRLTTTTDALTRLEEMYARIEMASDQVEMVRAMESSAQVLKGLHAEVGGVEGVERVVDRLTEEMETADDVQRVVAEAGAGDVDEAEVDDEFERLEEEQRVMEVGEDKGMNKEKMDGEQGRAGKMEAEGESTSETKGASEAQEVENTRERLKELEVVEDEARKKREEDASDELNQADKELNKIEKVDEASAVT